MKISGLSDPDPDPDSRSRFKIHNDFYIDTVVQSQSTILNTNTIDSEKVYTRFFSYFAKVIMKNTI
jgi:hypothetical protein